DNSSVRVLAADGTAPGLHFDVDSARAYTLEPPETLASPNPIDAIVTAQTPPRRPSRPSPVSANTSPLVAALASCLAYVESMSDVASVLVEPLTAAEDAAPLALVLGAGYARGDVALPEDVRQRNERELHARAVKKDPRLWYSRAWLVLDDAEQRGAI